MLMPMDGRFGVPSLPRRAPQSSRVDDRVAHRLHPAAEVLRLEDGERLAEGVAAILAFEVGEELREVADGRVRLAPSGHVAGIALRGGGPFEIGQRRVFVGPAAQRVEHLARAGPGVGEVEELRVPGGDERRLGRGDEVVVVHLAELVDDEVVVRRAAGAAAGRGDDAVGAAVA